MNKRYYSLKEIPKLHLIASSKRYSSVNEPNILKNLVGYNFVPNIISSFQDYDNLYLIMTYFEGETLSKFKNKKMTEEQIKFISACIIQSLTYLRKKKIINRDVQMHNIIMDNQKYFNLVDFSYSIKYSDKNNIDYYMVPNPKECPPEILNHLNYDYNSDYYRLGSILYYLIFKKYANQVKKEYNINEIFINKTLNNYSTSCIDFINKLLISDNSERIGFKNIKELKQHSWFEGFDWKNFENKRIISPFKFFSKKKVFCRKFNNDKNILLNSSTFEYYEYVNKKIIISILNDLKNF